MNSFTPKEIALHPLWRFLLAVLVIFGVFTLSGAIVGTLLVMAGVKSSLEATVFLEAIVFLFLILPTFKMMLAGLDRRPLASMGLAFHPRWGKELAYGLVIGATMILLVALVEWVGGFAKFSFTPHPFALGGVFALCLFAAAAVKEEVVFRGYAFQRLVEAITPAGAVLVTSALFGFVHLANPHHTWISTLNTALVGVLLCLAYLRTRALWLPIGIHFGWNFLQGFFLGLPVSGLIITTHIFTSEVTGPERITGGVYGPEGGIITTVVALGTLGWLALTKQVFTTEKMKSLISTPLPPPARKGPASIFSPEANEKDSGGVS